MVKKVRKPKVEVIEMSPQEAETLLENSQEYNPRHLRKSHVRFFCDILRTGNWHLSQDAIVVHNDGRLFNGQHRLAAIKETGIPAPVVLMTLYDDNIESFDQGLRRSPVDVLQKMGLIYATNRYVAITRAFYTMPADSSKRSRWPIKKMSEALIKCLPHIDWAMTAVENPARLQCGVMTALARAHAACGKEAMGDLGVFAEILGGSDGEKTTSRLPKLIRRMVMRRNPVGGGLQIRSVYAKTQSAIELFLNGKHNQDPEVETEDLFPIPKRLHLDPRWDELPAE